MQPSFIADAEEWLARVEQDLQMAGIALKVTPLLGAGAAYHAQQAGEKALKAYLTAFGVVFPRTHELELLLHACELIDARFHHFASVAQTLTPYANEFRYPGQRLEPPESEARQAVQDATRIVEFVRQSLGLDVSPPTEHT